MNEGIEIASAVASGAASVIEEQVTNGVAVRMAVLEMVAEALAAGAAETAEAKYERRDATGAGGATGAEGRAHRGSQPESRCARRRARSVTGRIVACGGCERPQPRVWRSPMRRRAP